MRDRVQAILEREIERINDISQRAGLELDDVRKLDLLIKAYKTFATEPPGQHDATPASIPTDDLLDALHITSGGARP